MQHNEHPNLSKAHYNYLKIIIDSIFLVLAMEIVLY